MEQAKMSTEAPPRPVTAEELLRMPDDGFRYELVEGELRKMAPAGGRHGKVVMDVALSLGAHVRANEIGAVYAAETGFRLATDPDTVRAPDVAFVNRERAEATREVEGYLSGAPDLAVEVISPRDSYSGVEGKALDWLDSGTRMVLVVDPGKRTVAVYRSRDEIRILAGDDLLDGGDVVPGWSVRVGSLFE